MSILTPIATAALATAATRTVSALVNNVSFADLFNQGESSQHRSEVALDGPVSANLGPAGRIELREGFEAKREELIGRIREALQANGIDLSQPIELTIAGGGRIRVENDHPDRIEIEEILSADSRIADDLRRLAATWRLLHPGQELDNPLLSLA